MSSALMLGVVKGVVIFLLLLFTLWRLALIAAAARPLHTPVNGFTPAAVVPVAVRNEGASLRGLLDVLERLEYPRDKLHFVLVNDSSGDATGRVLKSWTS